MPGSELGIWAESGDSIGAASRSDLLVGWSGGVLRWWCGGVVVVVVVAMGPVGLPYSSQLVQRTKCSSLKSVYLSVVSVLGVNVPGVFPPPLLSHILYGVYAPLLDYTAPYFKCFHYIKNSRNRLGVGGCWRRRPGYGLSQGTLLVLPQGLTY